ncbi:pectate lyase [Kineococcus sp. NUM-3379]
MALPTHPGARRRPAPWRRALLAAAAMLGLTASLAAAPTASAAPQAWPTATGTTTLSTTQKVSGTFDGANRRYRWSTDGGQSESQPPIFSLADGATLSNVIIGSPGADGVHCAGSCTLVNVWWEDVGEDAATFKGGTSATYRVSGGGARHAADKVFQHNGGGTLTIENFQVSDFGKLYRSCGNCRTQYKRAVVIRNVTATAPGSLLAGVNQNYGDTANLSGLTIVGDSSRRIKICTRYQGNNTGAEPSTIGSGPYSPHCAYDPAAISYR